jgi:hypothetical protein
MLMVVGFAAELAGARPRFAAGGGEGSCHALYVIL